MIPPASMNADICGPGGRHRAAVLLDGHALAHQLEHSVGAGLDANLDLDAAGAPEGGEDFLVERIRTRLDREGDLPV